MTVEATKTRRARTRGDRRAASILEAATDVFAERGYHATSLNDIAARAEIAKSVIYDHFESKAELYTAIIEGEARELRERRAAAVPEPGEAPTEERLRRGIDTFFRFVQERRAASRLLVRDAPATPELAEVHARLEREDAAAVATIFSKAAARDPEKRIRKEALATLVRTSIRGLARWWYDHPEVPREQLVEWAMDFAWSGLEQMIAVERGERPPKR